jgi:hypothetical protein
MKVSKSYMVLLGLEGYVRTKKKLGGMGKGVRSVFGGGGDVGKGGKGDKGDKGDKGGKEGRERKGSFLRANATDKDREKRDEDKDERTNEV